MLHKCDGARAETSCCTAGATLHIFSISFDDLLASTCVLCCVTTPVSEVPRCTASFCYIRCACVVLKVWTLQCFLGQGCIRFTCLLFVLPFRGLLRLLLCIGVVRGQLQSSAGQLISLHFLLAYLSYVQVFSLDAIASVWFQVQHSGAKSV